jgi:uracil-DNA glycosylase
MLSSTDYPTKIAESVHAWWREAGVEYLCEDDATNWLQPQQLEKPVISGGAPAAAIPESVATVAPVRIETEWPSDLAALKQAIAEGAALPGCHYGSRCVPPIGEAGSTALIVVDCPEDEEIAAGQYGEGPSGRLLKNMLLAAKILPDFMYQTALAHSRSAVTNVPKADLPLLADFVRHQVSLVQPKVIVLFGTAVCEALLGQELMQARGNLQYFNHDDRKTAAVATFHPRTLIAQPRMKAKAWQDLQMLARKDYL